MKTDSQIQQDVSAELRWEPSVDATQIGVEVKDGTVTLLGTVASYADKLSAERAAQRVYGVKALAVELNVALPGSDARTDADIASSVKRALEWTIGILPASIHVVVEKGWVTLSGDVSWDYQRRLATGAVRYLMGVKGVSDTIHIKSTVSSDVVKSDIEDALKRRWNSNADNVTVAVRGGEVTLSGRVDSWWDKEVAQQSAWNAPGVNRVVDNLTVSY